MPLPIPGYNPAALPAAQPGAQSLGPVPYGPGGAMIPSGQTAGSPGPGGAMSDAGTAISQAVRTLMNNLAPASVKDIQKKVAALTQQGEGGPTAKIAGGNAPLGAALGGGNPQTGGMPHP